jgi:hypothetical protein
MITGIMKTPFSPVKHPPARTRPQPTRLAAWLCSLALLLGSGFCFGEPCPTEEEEPEVVPPRERLDDAYLPRAYDPDDFTVLFRIRFTPPGYGQNTKHPTVISIPPTVFKNGDAFGVPSQRIATRELAEAGFLVFQVEHRLAPPGKVLHQPSHNDPASGRPPQQWDDIKQQILAALADPHCNQKIYLIGGSSGGCHALWCALDPAPGNITACNLNVVKKKQRGREPLGSNQSALARGRPQRGPGF